MTYPYIQRFNSKVRITCNKIWFTKESNLWIKEVEMEFLKIHFRTTIYFKFKETESAVDTKNSNRNFLVAEKSEEIYIYLAENLCTSMKKGIHTFNMSHGSIKRHLRIYSHKSWTKITLIVNVWRINKGNWC